MVKQTTHERYFKFSDLKKLSPNTHRLLVSIAVAFALTPACAEPITLSRVNELPATAKAAWKGYLEHSEANASSDAAAVQAEVIAKKNEQHPARTRLQVDWADQQRRHRAQHELG